MARPIRNTPILTGSDATMFIHTADSFPTESERLSERTRLEASVTKFKSMLAKLPR
ncbi:MAG: hypothetical protein KBT27_14400 [Prevotellaceae bacterium]|nr:hypothetical protein [Candidatus Faecinaster equi]